MRMITMNYEEMEDLRQQMQKINQALSLETDNYNALVEQCQALYHRLEKHAEITNKYGDFFANLYRQISEELENETDRPLEQGRIVFEIIDAMENIQDNVLEERQRIVDSGILEKEKHLAVLNQEITKKEAYLQGLRDAIQKAGQAPTPNTPKTKPSTSQPEPNTSKQAGRDINILDELDKHPPRRIDTPQDNSVGQQIPPKGNVASPNTPSNSNENTGVAHKPQPVPRQAPAQDSPSTEVSPQQQAPETKIEDGWTVPKHPEHGHLYLCASTGKFPLDITSPRLPDIRMQHLIRLGAEFARTGRPQFRLLRDEKGFLIGEQQNVINHINGQLLQGEYRIHHNDELVMTDRDGKQLKVRFVLG